jgi:Tol biopolymer transport system component/DNA-binding winged helix-turn-helix (wHTH) protein
LSSALIRLIDIIHADVVHTFQRPHRQTITAMASGSLPTEKAVRFGPFETNLLTGEVRKYGARIRLGGQPAQILSALLEKPGEIITREELRRKLWAKDTFVEFENGLNNAVKKLRSALGDSAGTPLYIETLPRVGYRFIAPIEKTNGAVIEAAGPSAVAGPTASEISPRANEVFHWRNWAFGIAAPLLAIAAYALLTPAPAPTATSFVQYPISEHLDGFAQLVTDGIRVYFLERSGNRYTVVQTSTAGGPTTPVATPFQNTRIFDVSPDRTEFLIGNFQAPKRGLPLWIWPGQGRSPIRVGDVIVDDASWAPNGQQILYARGQDIHVVARDGSGDRRLIHTAGWPHGIRFSPDGRKMIFTVDSIQSDEQTLWEAAADGSHPHPRFPGWSVPPSECCAEWTPDGRYFVFSSRHAGFENLWAVRERRSLFHWRSPVPVQLTPTARALGAAVLTRNGTRAFVMAWNEAWQFERYNSLSRSFRPLPMLQGAFSVQPSRDGANFAVVKQDWTLWRTKADGSEPLQLTAAPLEMAQPQWSPDGTRIAFEGHTPGKLVRVYVVNAAGGPIQEVLPREGEQGVPAWSPDGTRIAIAVNVFVPSDTKEPRGIYIVDWKTRQATKVRNSDGLTAPEWSPDGKYFIAKTADEGAILLFDPPTQTWKPIAKGTVLSGLTWSRDSQYLYVQKIADDGQPIHRLHAGDFKWEPVVSFRSALQEGFDLCVLQHATADGSLIVRLRSGGGHVYAMDLNFP